MKITEENNTAEITPLTTEAQKIDWLNNAIKDLERMSCADPENKQCTLQMFRELLSIKMTTCRDNAVKKIKDNLSKDIAEFIKDFGTDLTDAEKTSIKSLTCLQFRA